MRAFLVATLSALLVACSHSLIISDSSETATAPDKGSVRPIRDSVAGSKNIYLVMIHGVGDHCPGYALGKKGWLNNSEAQRLGIHRVSEIEDEILDIHDNEFVTDKNYDPNSKVTYRKAVYQDTVSAARIIAIEITWSQLTQWKKTQQLGYDSGTDAGRAGEGEDCIYMAPPGDQSADSKPPPSRVLLNRVIKEKTFNRNLVDAIFYVGEYGKTIQRGVAEALCRSIGGSAHLDQGTGRPDGQLCLWPGAGDAFPPDTRFVFVTHSLGSRALYDVLLGLTGDRVNSQSEVFSPHLEVERSRDIVCRIIGSTAAVYMMANQLPLLGLAYDDGKAVTTDGPQPYDASRDLPVRGCGPRTSENLEAARNTSTDTDSFPATISFARVWQRAREVERDYEGELTIVAFNDTNDLLTWGIPRWYAEKGRFPLSVTNVFVKNGTRWFGAIVNPAAAHSGYFGNPEVWSVILCGAQDGKLGDCEGR